MKQLTALLLCAALILSACAAKTEPLHKPATFYYRTVRATYDGSTPIIASEERESALFGDDMVQLLNNYFSGPVSETLVSPFPKNLKVSSYSTLGSTVMLELSSEFAQLSGLGLTIACACIASTVLSVPGFEQIQISAANSQLDGQRNIMLNRDSILLLDLAPESAAAADTTADTTE